MAVCAVESERAESPGDQYVTMPSHNQTYETRNFQHNNLSLPYSLSPSGMMMVVHVRLT